VEQFQELLDKNASIFYCARTAKSLHNHWLLLKQYSLLPDQSVKPLYGMDQQPIIKLYNNHFFYNYYF